MKQELIIPILGMLMWPLLLSQLLYLSGFYFEGKGKEKTVLEISKHLDDPQKLEELLTIFEDRKKLQLIIVKWKDYLLCWDRSLPLWGMSLLICFRGSWSFLVGT